MVKTGNRGNIEELVFTPGRSHHRKNLAARVVKGSRSTSEGP